MAGAGWEQNANVGNVPTIISAWDSDLVRNRMLQTQHIWKEELQHKSTRWRCEIPKKWTTIASSKTWAGSATNMWTRCPRQAWSRSSLIIKQYRVQVGNHNRGYWSPCIRHALKKELPFLEQINQWLVVLGDTYGMKMILNNNYWGASWEQNANVGNDSGN